MGLIFSWFKGSTEQQALQDVTVETQVKIEDAVVNKTVPKEKNNDSPLVVPTPLSNDDALESLSAGFTNSAPSALLEEPVINDVSLPVTQSIPDKPGSVPLDALGALSDTLAAPEPEPEPPKIDPKDVVNEGTVGTEDAELLGEREDTIPPEYRFAENGTDLLPPEDEKPNMDSGEALDILSGDFAAVPAAPLKQPCLEALDMLDGEFADPAQALVEDAAAVSGNLVQAQS